MSTNIVENYNRNTNDLLLNENKKLRKALRQVEKDKGESSTTNFNQDFNERLTSEDHFILGSMLNYSAK